MFVVFEGIDGSGKTTVSNLVAERLARAGLKVKHLRADGKFVVRGVGGDPRASGATRATSSSSRKAEFLLYVARDVQLIEQALRPALAATTSCSPIGSSTRAEVLGRTGRAPAREIHGADPRARRPAGCRPISSCSSTSIRCWRARGARPSSCRSLDKRPPSRKGLAGVGLQHRAAPRLPRSGRGVAASAGPWSTTKTLLEDTVARVTALDHRGARADGTPAALDTLPRRERPRAARRRRSDARRPRSPAEALPAFLKLIDKRMEREPGVAAYLLGGLAGPGDRRTTAAAGRAGSRRGARRAHRA